MRQFLDEKTRSQVAILDSPTQAVEAGFEEYWNSHRHGQLGGHWQGRKFGSIEGVKTALTRPWEEGLMIMEEFRRKLDRQLPEPESVRRRMEWNETGGDLAVSRLLAGDPVMFRAAKRRRTVAPKNIAVLCNTAENVGAEAEQIMWRGAAAVAAVDLLEAAGYSVEFWIWNRATNAYYGSCPNWFMAAKVKSCGDPLDTDLLLNSISAWFLRMICIGFPRSSRCGFTQRPTSYGELSFRSDLGDHIKHLDVSDGITTIPMGSPKTPDGAVQAALEVLVKAAEGGDE